MSNNMLFVAKPPSLKALIVLDCDQDWLSAFFTVSSWPLLEPYADSECFDRVRQMVHCRTLNGEF